MSRKPKPKPNGTLEGMNIDIDKKKAFSLRYASDIIRKSDKSNNKKRWDTRFCQKRKRTKAYDGYLSASNDKLFIENILLSKASQPCPSERVLNYKSLLPVFTNTHKAGSC